MPHRPGSGSLLAMNDDPVNLALLPAGLRDLLPPEAETEAAFVAALMAVFASHGYQRVKPPLMEFDDSLLAGSGAAVADQTFRLMDPNTHRPMGIRADMTPQVARIATTRLVHAARPLRLSYAGQCLLLRGISALLPERQVAQAGIELIGHDSPAADAEIVLVGAEALAAVGLTRLSYDLTLPQLVPALLDQAGFPANDRATLSRALDRKDAVAVASYGGGLAGMLAELLLAAGPAERALAALEKAKLHGPPAILAQRLAETVAAIRQRAPTLKLTIDPVEFRGFRYHTGVSLTIYAPGCAEELGRGGRYVCGEAEPATGLTLYPDAALRAAPARKPMPRIFLPIGTAVADAAAMRRDGFATVAALDPASSVETEARRLHCTHVFVDGTIAAIPE